MLNIVNQIHFSYYSSSYPLSLLGIYVSDFLKAWSSGDAEIFAVVLVFPISSFLITSNKKDLIIASLCFLPPLTLLRRTVLGAQFLVGSISLVVKNGAKAIVTIGILVIICFSAVLFIEPLRDRTFGGDVGSVSGISNKELVSSTKYINTSGRAGMWLYVTENFYVDHEMFGCGLGTMKQYLKANEDGGEGETAHFAMLHNDHLHLLIELGNVGMAFFVLFSLALVRDLIRNMKRKKNSVLFVINFSAFASFVAILFCMFFSNILSQVFEISVCFMIIGMAMRLNNNSRNNNSFRHLAKGPVR